MYIKFTAEQVERAKQCEIAEILESRGEQITRSGSEWQWVNQGHKITLRKNTWYDQYDQVGGVAIDFVMRYFGYAYPEAMRMILKMSDVQYVGIPLMGHKRVDTDFVMPPAAENMHRVFAYLCQSRYLDSEIVSWFAHHRLLYESMHHHNCVFCGYADDGKSIRHGALRGTNSQYQWRGNVPGSDPECAFHYCGGGSRRLYVYESPIDLMSYICLHKDGWRGHNYVAMCGVGLRAMWHRIERMQLQTADYIDVVLCLDADPAGRSTSDQAVKELLQRGGCNPNIDYPPDNCKDWNDALIADRRG